MNIPRDVRDELVETLLRVPFVPEGGRAGRDALLAGLPSVFLYRAEAGNAFADVRLLVTQAADVFGPNGEWCVLQLADNALAPVRGTEVGAKLLKIRERLVEVQRGLWPVPVHVAEVAQVHLFDLWRPVGICILSLPLVTQTSGFVVTAPTKELLGYFCDSLKQRGVDESVWARHEVATRPPMEIDPKHTTVAFAANKSDQVRSLLAQKHVLWPIYVANVDDAAALWQQLQGAFENTLEHHLVITFGMPEGTKPPDGMTLLPVPKFTSKDISNWVSPIAKRLTWHEKEIDWWVKLILVNCDGNQENLPIKIVYEQLEHHSRLVTQHHRNPEDLMNALKDLETWSLSEGNRARYRPLPELRRGHQGPAAPAGDRGHPRRRGG